MLVVEAKLKNGTPEQSQRLDEAIKYLSKINYTYLTTSCLLPLASCLSSLGN